MQEIRRLFVINDKGHLSKKNFNEDLFKQRYPEIWAKIVGFSETHLVWKEKVFRYINNITETPKCACGCGNEVTFGKANNYHYFKYTKFYSPRCYTGENNPFHGREHTQKSKDQVSVTKTGVPAHPNIAEKTRQRLLVNNHFLKKTPFEWLLGKYGKEEAERRWEEKRERDRRNMTGKNNPMYGMIVMPGKYVVNDRSY